MTNYCRCRLLGGTFFFTANLADRRKSLLTDHIDDLRAAFRDVMSAHPFRIHAIVVLPEHHHCLWELPPGDSDYRVKMGFAALYPSYAACG